MGISVFLIKLPVLPLQNRTTHSARRSRTYLWPNGIVRYRFHSNVDSDTREKICKAISKWEAKTCLKFHYRISLPCFRISLPRFRITQSDYIEFTADDSNKQCVLNTIGKKGGEQRIQLGPTCRTEGIIMHEIGHAIGLWHEPSRPDRDCYVNVVWDNIADGSDEDSNTENERNQFRKRTTYEVDHYGSTYDYGSIMHYSKFAFGNGKTTIVVTNNAEYDHQQRSQLSIRDTKQVS